MPTVDLSKRELGLVFEALEAHKEGIKDNRDADDTNWENDLADTKALIERLGKQVIQSGVNNG